MKILLIAPPILPIPLQGYGGVEQVVYDLAVGMHAEGNEVAVVCVEGSELPDGIEPIAVPKGQSEESMTQHYGERVREFDVIHDHTWQAWVYVIGSELGVELPIVHTMHADPSVFGSPPPVRFPGFVGISTRQARSIAMFHGVEVKRVYNGVSFDKYVIDPEMEKKDRLLAIGRYTAEKGMLEAIQMSQRLRLPLDVVGDTTIVSSRDYVRRCMNACDGLMARFSGPVSRDKTVEMYQSYQALLFPLNWEEPFGLAIIEAQLCGLPVMTLTRGAMTELVEWGKGGFAYETPDELEEGLKAEHWKSIDPEAARESAMRFSIERMLLEYGKLYTDVVEGRRW